MIGRCKPALLAGALWMAALGPVAVYGQNFEKIKPKTPAPLGAGGAVTAPAEQSPQPGASEEVLVKKLASLVLEGQEKATGPMGPPAESDQRALSATESESLRPRRGHLQPIVFENLTPPEPEKLAQKLSSRIGQPITMVAINAMVVEIIQFYRAHDRPLVDVSVPEQDITQGVLRLKVLESRLGAVRAEKNRWFSSKLLENEVRGKPGEIIYGSRVLADVEWLNANPFREVNAIYTPGKEFGSTDILLETRDRFPLRVYTGYENTGTPFTGNDRWLAGFNWGNVFGLDQLLSYQLTTSDDFHSSLSHSASYTLPLPWRHTLAFFGSYSESSAPVVINGQSFNNGGASSQASLRYSIPLPGTPHFKEEISAGFDFKRSNNNLDFGGTRVFDKSTDIFQGLAGYTAQIRDTFGTTLLDLSGVFSPGNLDGSNTDPIFDQSRKYAKANYSYGRLVLERLNRLPANWTLDMKSTFQASNGNLLASEQLGVGGYGSVRGYAEGATRGDSGLLLNTELRAPAVALLGHWKPKLADQFQPLGFVDYGVARLHTPLPGETRQMTLASIGMGFRYTISNNLSMRCDYGWQLLDAHDLHASLCSFGVTLGY